jgi:hypothetical protein
LLCVLILLAGVAWERQRGESPYEFAGASSYRSFPISLPAAEAADLDSLG